MSANSTISGGLSLSGGALTATGTGVSLTVSGTTTATGGNLSATGGATLSLGELTSYTLTTNFDTTTLEASGANSVLSLPKLTTIAANHLPGTGRGRGRWRRESFDTDVLGRSTRCPGPKHRGKPGGRVGRTDFDSKPSEYGTPGVLTATDQGTIVDPKLTTLNNVSVTLDGTGTLSTDPWTTLTSSTLTVTAGSYSFPILTDIDTTNSYVQTNASLTLPGAFDFAH